MAQQTAAGSGSSGKRSRSSSVSCLLHLTAISEGDEHTSLMDVLVARDGPLNEEELWSVCREGCLAVHALGDSSEAFQTVCLSPDTLAFDAYGNVRLLSLDRSGDDITCQPPEFYQFGNSYKGHIYSLGSAMLMAAHYNVSDGSKTRHSRRLSELLTDMTEGDYEGRADLDRVLSECSAHLRGRSSRDVCRTLVAPLVASARRDHGPLSPLPGESASLNNELSPIDKPFECSGSIRGELGYLQSEVASSLARVKRELGVALAPCTAAAASIGGAAAEDDDSVLYRKMARVSNSAFDIRTAATAIDPSSTASAFMTTLNLVASNATNTAPKASGQLSPENSRRDSPRWQPPSLPADSTAIDKSAQDKIPPIPPAYTSNATHFAPIILASENKSNSPAPTEQQSSDQDRFTVKKIRELKKRLLRNRQLVDAACNRLAGETKSPLKADDGHSKVNGMSAAEDAQSYRSPVADLMSPGLSSPLATSSGLSTPSQDRRGDPLAAKADTPPPSSSPPPVVDFQKVPAPFQTLAPTSRVDSGQGPQPASLAFGAADDPSIVHSTVSIANKSTTAAAAVVASFASNVPASFLPPFSQPVPFFVRQDPSTGVLQLIPLYSAAAEGGALFLPPSIGLHHIPPSPSVAQTKQPGDQNDPTGITVSAERGIIAGSARGERKEAPSPLASRKAGVPREANAIERSPLPSPSLSKDSGVGSVSHYSGDPHLIERLLASGNHRQNQLLGKLIKLIRDEFAFDGYLDNGIEDLAMAEYTASLAGLKWDTFESAITEKYCDLYWEDELLSRLYEAVNGKLPPSTPLTVRGKPKVESEPTAPKAKLPDTKTTVVHSPFRPISTIIGEAAAASKVQLVSGHVLPREQHSVLIRPTALLSPPQQRSLSQSSDLPGDVKIGATDTSVTATRAVGLRHGRKRQAPHPLSRMKSSSVQDLLAPCKERMIGRSFSQSELDRPNVPLRKSESRVSLNMISNGLLVSGLSGSVPVICVHGQDAKSDEFSLITSSRRRATVDAFSSDCTSFGHHTSAPCSTHNASAELSQRESSLRDLGSTSRCSDGSVTLLSQSLSAASSEITEARGTANDKFGCAEESITRKIDIIYYTATLQGRLDERLKQAIDKAGTDSHSGLLKHLQEVEQQLSVHRKQRTKTLKYCRRLPDTVHRGKVEYDQKAVLDKALLDLQEANDELDLLLNIKRHLEMLLAEQFGLADNLIYSLAKVAADERLLLSVAPDNPLLQYKNRTDGLSRRRANALHAGTPLGLMANLFARGSLPQQYIHYFFYCYRYFVTSSQLFNFLVAKYMSALIDSDQNETQFKVKNRAVDLLQAWLEGNYSVDFKHDATLQDSYTTFLQEQVAHQDPGKAEFLFQLLEDLSQGRRTDLAHVSAVLRDDIDVTRKVGDREWQLAAKKVNGKDSLILGNTPESPLVGVGKRQSIKLQVSAGKHGVMYAKGRSGIVSCMQSADRQQDRESYYASTARKTEAFSLADYSSQTIAEQLTLVEQAFFERCHPVHFTNSKAQGIEASLASLNHSGTTKACVWDEKTAKSAGSLFVGSYAQDAIIQCMIEHSQSVSYWVAAELVSCSSVKHQLALLTKFIYTAKICKEIRNYATCVAVVDGLENLIVRQLPAWKDISSKSIEELKNVKVFLSSDAMCLTDNGGEGALLSTPTLPSVLLFILHIQQMEQGAFTLANGMYKWSKMRSIAKAVDQIRLFKQHRYEFEPRTDLCDDLVARMKDLCLYELQTLAASHNVNFPKPSASKWANAIRKIKGAFSG